MFSSVFDNEVVDMQNGFFFVFFFKFCSWPCEMFHGIVLFWLTNYIYWSGHLKQFMSWSCLKNLIILGRPGFLVIRYTGAF